MTDNQEREAPSAPAPSRIVLTFAGPGEPDVQVAMENVTPLQVYAAVHLLAVSAENYRQALAARTPGGLVIPAGPLPGMRS